MKIRIVCLVGLLVIPAGVVCARDSWIRVVPPSPIIVSDESPAVIVEPPGPCPGPGYVWVSGAWEAHRGHWVWIRGRWELPPRGRYVWEPGRWEYRGHDHHERVWINAHWR